MVEVMEVMVEVMVVVLGKHQGETSQPIHSPGLQVGEHSMCIGG